LEIVEDNALCRSAFLHVAEDAASVEDVPALEHNAWEYFQWHLSANATVFFLVIQGNSLFLFCRLSDRFPYLRFCIEID